MNPRATDHLANERTFLAWVRTSISLLGLGFVLARMGLFLRQIAAEFPGEKVYRVRPGEEFLWVGVIFLLIGTGLAGLSGWLHDRTRRAIDEGNYVPARRVILAVTVIVVLGGLAIASLLIWRTSVGMG